MLLAKVIELGLSLKVQTPKGNLLHSVSVDTVEELRSINVELLSSDRLEKIGAAPGSLIEPSGERIQNYYC